MGDEISFALGGATNSYIHWISVGGFSGGFAEDNIMAMIHKMLSHDTYDLRIERNTGAGAVTALFIAQLDKLKLLCNVEPNNDLIQDLCSSLGVQPIVLHERLQKFGVSDYFSTGQKELRIINTISPMTRRHKIVAHTNALSNDWGYCKKHAPDKRNSFSAFYQLMNITTDRNSLVHDDRLDCLQRLTQELTPFVSKDETKGAEKRKEEDFKNWLDNPMGYVNNLPTSRRGANRGRLSTVNRSKSRRKL